MNSNTMNPMTASRVECDRHYNDPQLKALVIANNWKGIIDYCSGSNHGDYTAMWSRAMTAHYGPVGLHESRTFADGTPNPEMCKDLPYLFERMERVKNDVRRIMGILVSEE